VRDHTATALNFQLTMLIAAIVGSVLTLVLVGFLILVGVSIAILVLSILAAVAANRGQAYTYPLAIRFIKN
jgi:uncharacterized Tic20 family protein